MGSTSEGGCGGGSEGSESPGANVGTASALGSAAPGDANFAGYGNPPTPNYGYNPNYVGARRNNSAALYNDIGNDRPVRNTDLGESYSYNGIGTGRYSSEGYSYANGIGEDPSNSALPQATCSFRGDMLVRIPNGSMPIAQIRQGQDVLARNEVTGEISWRMVEKLHQRTHPITVNVTVEDEGGNEQTLVSNDRHPYFAQINDVLDFRALSQSSEGHSYRGDIPQGQWVDAQALKNGYRLLSESGQWLTVTKVDVKKQTLKAYNLTVAHDHTYFIGAPGGKEGVWVHNEGMCAIPDSRSLSRKVNDGIFYVSAIVVTGYTVIQMAVGNNENAGDSEVESGSSTASSAAATPPPDDDKNKGSSKGERHGDGNAMSKAEKQIQKLNDDLSKATSRKERMKIETKINNVRRTAQKNAKGETHGVKGY